VRICIISDLHANAEALSAIPGDYDELWVLGDLVNYGPDPAAVIDFVRSHAAVVIRGNHDHSVGFDADCGCSPRFRVMAEATRNYTASVLGNADKQYLHDLPVSARREIDGTTFFLGHATPSNLLYEYRPPESPLWERPEAASAGAGVILAGHTHLQFSRTVDGRIVVNPGSLGQSKSGDPRARYAIWENGRFSLRAAEYPFARTIEKVMAMPIEERLKRDLGNVLKTGTVPKADGPASSGSK
jgi:putative phosphoesterase